MRIWVASLIFYAFVFAVCEILRFLILAIFPPKLLRTQLLLEVTTFSPLTLHKTNLSTSF